jgi:hypothetical protein
MVFVFLSISKYRRDNTKIFYKIFFQMTHHFKAHNISGVAELEDTLDMLVSECWVNVKP